MSRTLHYSFSVLLFMLCWGSILDVCAQSALNSGDAVVTYDPKTPPVSPVYDKITKWVRTVRMPYNTDSYKCYIYKNMAFRLKFPKTYVQGASDGKKYPIYLFFHGVGQKGTLTDNENQLYWGGQTWANRVDDGTFDGFLLFPQSEGGFWGTTEYINAKELVDSIVDGAKGDPDRLYVNGLSAGGWGTWEFMMRYPQLVAAALPMSAMTLDYANHIDTYKFIPMWLFQGGQDGNPAPYTTNQVATRIKAAGANFKLTTYPQADHNTWVSAWNEPDFTSFMLRANRLNPYPLFGTTKLCPGDAITAGISPGYQQYEWQKDNITITTATTNAIAITTAGTYRVRARLPEGWTGWSPVPLVITNKSATPAPVITTSPVLSSNVLPATDGNTSITMQVPPGMETYEWIRAGSATVLSSTNALNTSNAGEYMARVKSTGNCISVYSDAFRVVAAAGSNGPDAISRLTVTSSTDTHISLSWQENATPAYNETYFEIYRATQTGGPYILVGKNSANVNTFIDNSITANTSYFYKVRPVNNNAAGPVSAEVKGGNGPVVVNNPPPSNNNTTAQKLLLHFKLNVDAPASWNNITGSTTANLKNDKGETTNIGLKFDESWWAAGIEGPTTGNNSGVYPDVVLSEYLYFGSLPGFFTGVPEMHGHLTGLSANATYTIKFHSGSKWWAPKPDNGNTRFTVNGVSKTLYVQNNTANTADFTNLTADAKGEIAFTLSIPTGGQVGYLNALELDIVPNAPASIGNNNRSMNIAPRASIDNYAARKDSLLVNIYPNPYVDNLSVDLTLNKLAPSLLIEISDLSGKILYSEIRKSVPEGRNLFQINTGGSVVVTGIYILRITTTTGETKSIKLVKK